MIRKWLAHPLTRGLDIDAPQTTELRRQIIRDNGFLRKIYQEWYSSIAVALPAGEGQVLELGSGAGFFDEFVPGLITSEIFQCANAKIVLNGVNLPFADASLRAIVMTDVLHHLPDPGSFFAEAARCVQSGGVVAMIEPWLTTWSRWIYTHLHHEPFCPNVTVWEFPSMGPLSSANGALPWIIFKRDRSRFEVDFPVWQIKAIRPFMPFRYLLSGGVSMRGLMPAWTFTFWSRLESMLQPWMNHLAMFSLVVLKRR